MTGPPAVGLLTYKCLPLTTNTKNQGSEVNAHAHNTDQLATASLIFMPILTGSSLRVANHRRVHLHLFIISTLLGQCVQGLWSGDEGTGMTVAHSLCTSLHVNKLDSFQFRSNIVTSCYLAVHRPTRIQMEIKTTSTPMASSQKFTEQQI